LITSAGVSFWGKPVTGRPARPAHRVDDGGDPGRRERVGRVGPRLDRKEPDPRHGRDAGHPEAVAAGGTRDAGDVGAVVGAVAHVAVVPEGVPARERPGREVAVRDRHAVVHDGDHDRGDVAEGRVDGRPRGFGTEGREVPLGAVERVVRRCGARDRDVAQRERHVAAGAQRVEEGVHGAGRHAQQVELGAAPEALHGGTEGRAQRRGRAAALGARGLEPGRAAGGPAGRRGVAPRRVVAVADEHPDRVRVRRERRLRIAGEGRPAHDVDRHLDRLPRRDEAAGRHGAFGVERHDDQHGLRGSGRERPGGRPRVHVRRREAPPQE
jgi:hypothetical protein